MKGDARDALVSACLYFVLGFALTLGVFCLLGCAAEDRAGHRVAFHVDRLEGDGGSFTSTGDGPGPHDTTASGDFDPGGWAYGLEYSIPVGDSEDAGQLRLMNAHLAGMRAELEAASEKPVDPTLTLAVSDLRGDIADLTYAVEQQTQALAAAEAVRRAAPAMPSRPAVEPQEPPAAPATASHRDPASEAQDEPKGAKGGTEALFGLGGLGLGALAWNFRKPILGFLASLVGKR